MTQQPNKDKVTPPTGNNAKLLLADAALTENARNFLLGHDKLSLMKWKFDSIENKIRWMEYLKPKDKSSPFLDECIRLINVGYS